MLVWDFPPPFFFSVLFEFCQSALEDDLGACDHTQSHDAVWLLPFQPFSLHFLPDPLELCPVMGGHRNPQ